VTSILGKAGVGEVGKGRINEKKKPFTAARVENGLMEKSRFTPPFCLGEEGEKFVKLGTRLHAKTLPQTGPSKREFI